MKKVVIILGVVILALIGVLLLVQPVKGPTTENMPSSSAATSGAQDVNFVSGQPAQSPDGHLRVSKPSVGQLVSSPVTLIGNVSGGGWFFEAVFPVKILDAAGTVLGSGQSQAQGDWTATIPVPFSATIAFAKPHSATGTIVFARDNPAGSPQHAQELRVPIKFQ